MPPAPRGMPQVEVTFDIDANGILNVTAQDKGTGKQQNITVTASSGLTKDEIDKMVKDAQANAAEDAKRKQEIEVRNQTDSLVYSTERSLAEHGAKLAEADKKAIDDALAEAREALRRLARQYSPDVNFWDAQARALFEEISEAYRVLSDPAARTMYDRFGTAVLGDAALPAGRRGEDAHVAVELEFAQVVRGARTRVDVQRFSPCAACGASGQAAGARCAACAGRGVRQRLEGGRGEVPGRAGTGGAS